MKRFVKTILAIVVPIICILIATVIYFLHSPKQTAQNDLTPENALVLYRQVTDRITAAGDTRMILNKSTTRTIGEETFLESSNQIISIDATQNNEHRYRIYEELSHKAGKLVFEDSYINGFEYVSISGAKFRSEISEEDFEKKIPPMVMLSPFLYADVHAVTDSASHCISFNNATEPESWASKEAMQFLSASGTAAISIDGLLISSTYTISYQQNDVRYDVCYHMSLEAASLEIQPPSDDNRYITLSDPTAIRALEQAAVNILQADVVKSNYREEIYFEALGDRRIRNIALSVQNITALEASIATETIATNDSRLDWSDRSVKEEEFRDQEYRITINDVTNEIPAVQAEDMQRYLQNQLISTIMLPSYIDSCTTIDNESTLRYEFLGNTAFINFLCSNACEQLYQDPQLLQLIKESFQTEMLACHLEIDTKTGLPISSGIEFNGYYLLEGLPYIFSYSAVQEYQFPMT